MAAGLGRTETSVYDGVGEVADSSTFTWAGIRKRETLEQALKTQSPSPVIHCLQQGHTYPNRAKPPNHFQLALFPND